MKCSRIESKTSPSAPVYALDLHALLAHHDVHLHLPQRARRAARRCAELSGKLAAAEAQARRLAARAARSTAGAAAQGGRAAVAMHGARRLGERRAREAARAAMAAMLSDDDSD